MSNQGSPTEVGIWFPLNLSFTEWAKAYYPLASDGEPNWTGHTKSPQVDVAVMPIKPPLANFQPIRLQAMTNPQALEIGCPIYLPGFPLGMDSDGEPAGFGGHPICKTCHLATELAYNHKGLPAALVDGTCRPGMSGAPALVRDGENWVCYGLFTGYYSDAELGVIAKVSTVADALHEAKARRIPPIEAVRIHTGRRS